MSRHKMDKNFSPKNSLKVSLSFLNRRNSPALSTAWSTNESAALLPINPERKDMFLECVVVDVCKSGCMCQCFGASDACGFIGLLLRESMSGMCVPIGYCRLGGVKDVNRENSNLV